MNGPVQPPVKRRVPTSPIVESDDEDSAIILIGPTSGPRSRTKAQPVPTGRPSSSSAPPMVRRNLTLEVERPKDRIEDLFERANSVDNVLDRVQERYCTGDAELIELIQRVREGVLSIARRAAVYCEEYAAEVTCMRQTLAEEMVDVDIHSSRILEQQRKFEARGNKSDADILAQSVASASRIERASGSLHPHDSFMYPLSARVNGEVLDAARAHAT